jgi:catechol 2,3-dioxygenase-like lactoylglutathione lyase family enzyme
MHHIHFATPNVEAMRAWYVTTFGAKPGKRGSLEAADLGGVNLTFSPASGPVAPLKGRVLDHIGFEIKDLANYDKVVESRGGKLARPPSKVATLPLWTSWATDPWGTEIELTDGFAAIP